MQLPIGLSAWMPSGCNSVTVLIRTSYQVYKPQGAIACSATFFFMS